MQILDPVSLVLKQKNERIWSIAPTATVYEALSVMAEKEIGSLVVMEGGRMVGLISERDYARKVILRGRSSKETTVDEIMTSPAVTIDPSSSVDDAMRIMTENRVRHLPVIDSKAAVLGIVSIGDLVKWIITSHEQTIEQLQSYIAGRS
ncbi:MAG TPA: CBS domain-containing protein [Bryobacteraceae bacterium]|nr:CBS domain-containing protein [Bryobacteraceae bacterium]